MIIIDKKTIANYLSKYISYFTEDEIENLIEIPPSTINFSYAFPVFQLAKFEKKSPKIIAEELKEQLKLPSFLEEIEVNGPYLNFRVKLDIILENIFQLNENYGNIRDFVEKDKFVQQKVVVEYPSPNTNKPLHLGHVRNMLIGNTLSKFLDYKGHEIYQVNLNNDRGIHICKSMLAYKNWGNNQEPSIKTDHFVGEWYVKFDQEAEKDPKLSERATSLLKLWEKNDPETRELWDKMNKWALNGFKETYKKFGISFDKEYFESKLYKEGKEIILNNVQSGILNKTDDGAVIANLEKTYNLPDKILLRNDGTSIYITQDIYLAYLKKEDFNYTKSIYVVGNEQDLYFKQLFAVLEMIGFKEDKFHLSYGMISLPEGKMKSREGIVVDADDIIEKMQTLAFEEVNNRYPNLLKDEKLNRSGIIGMAALKFFILKFNPKSDFIFNPKESISFEGETGPYIQYCYARIESIISKSKEMISLNIEYERLNHVNELSLIKHLNYFPEVLDQAISTYGIHLIPQYLLALCQNFNSFYSTCKVISEDKVLERARLLLIKCVQIVVKIGLNLLGIEPLEEM